MERRFRLIMLGFSLLVSACLIEYNTADTIGKPGRVMSFTFL